MQRKTKAQESLPSKTYLINVVRNGELDDNPSLFATVIAALKSSDAGTVGKVARYVHMQLYERQVQEALYKRQQARQRAIPKEKQEPLFWEPTRAQLRELKGEIYIGETIPSRYPVRLPVSIFGSNNHAEILGGGGSGKSSNIDSILAQLVQSGRLIFSFDTENQSAQRLIPILPANRLNVININNYKFNPLWGDDSYPQLDYVRDGWNFLAGSLDLSPRSMQALFGICERIIRRGQIANFERVLEELEKLPQTQSHNAIFNRLFPLDDVYRCEKGMDRKKVLSRSTIFEIKNCSEPVRLMLYNDLYHYICQTEKSFNEWQLRYVFMYHEAGELLSNPSPYFKDRIRKVRNYGVGFFFADQAPQAQDQIVRSLIGAKLIMRLGDRSCLRDLKDPLGLNKDQEQYILRGIKPKREMLVSLPGFDPFLVTIPELY
jgi:hypothetical protein